MPTADRNSEAHHPRVVVLTAADEELLPGLQPLEEIATVRHAFDRESLMRHLPEADVLVVTDFRRPLLRDAWHSATRLRWIHATSAGVDALLFPELIQSDVRVTNARGIFDGAIAEFVLGQILVFAKDFHTSFELKRQHRWRHRETECIEGRRVLVVGAGSIGRRIGEKLRAAGMQIEGIASRERADPVFGVVYGIERLHERLPTADFVVISTPLTPRTHGLFRARELGAMQPTARLINIGRGEVVHTDDLVEALRRGIIAGAALDVFETEPLPSGHPLYELPQVIVTSHMAGDFVGWREALSRQFLDNFERWRRGEPLANVVDKERGYGSPAISEDHEEGMRHDR